jgi:hypothetical protein
MPPFNYQLFGLRIHSEIPLPELFHAETGGAPDVTIRRGRLNGGPETRRVQADGEALLLTIPNVARYRVEAGAEIIVDAGKDVPERNVRLFLLGSAFGALLHQRGLLPLHANAVEIDGRAVAFMGASGAGKSTLAAWFHDRGFPILADDVCVLRFESNGEPVTQPGLPRLRLWEEVLKATGREASHFPRSYSGDESFNKYDVSARANAAREPRALVAAFLLERGESFGVEPLNGVSAVQAVFDNTYRGRFLDHTRGHGEHWAKAVQLVRTVPIYRVTRAWDLDRLGEQCELILDFARSTAASGR